MVPKPISMGKRTKFELLFKLKLYLKTVFRIRVEKLVINT